LYVADVLIKNSCQANIHSFLESDDRVGAVMKYMDEAIAELDNMETLISTYKIHLNVSEVYLQVLLSPICYTGRRR